MLKDLANIFARPLERLWGSGKYLEDWKKANVSPIFEKGKKEDLGYYRLSTFILIPGKMMEQIILETILNM